MNLMALPLLALKRFRGTFKDVTFFIASLWSRSQLTNSPVLCLSWKNVKTASSISGNRPFLGPVNFLCDASHPLIAVLCFRHSQMLLSSTPKTAAALWFPFSSAHRITSCLNFAVYDSLLDLVSLFHNYGTRQIGISTFHVSTTKAWAGFRQDCACLLRKAHFTVPVWLIGPRHSVGF